MTVERRHHEKRTDLEMTACEYCGEPLGFQENFPQHWRLECPKNPANGTE